MNLAAIAFLQVDAKYCTRKVKMIQDLMPDLYSDFEPYKTKKGAVVVYSPPQGFTDYEVKDQDCRYSSAQHQPLLS